MKHSTIKNISSFKEKFTAQSVYLINFSAKQIESLTTFVSNVISNAIQPIQGYLNKKVIKLSSEIIKILLNQKHLTSNIANLQAIIKKMISFQHFNGEKPTTQVSFLPRFSANKAQDFSNPSYPSNPSIPGNRNLNTRRHITTESLFSAGERPTVKGGFLTDFSIEKPQNPSHIKQEFTL